MPSYPLILQLHEVQWVYLIQRTYAVEETLTPEVIILSLRLMMLPVT